MADGSVGLVTDLVFNGVCDWLSPAEYDGKAMLQLPPNDPRLRASALLAWEAQSMLHRAGQVLAPLRSFLVSVSARDKVGRLVQYFCKLCKELLVLVDAHRHHHLIQRLRTVTFDLSNARRTFRVAEVGPLLTLTRLPTVLADEPHWRSRLVSCVAIAGFNLCDRARWLQDHGLMRGSSDRFGLHAARLLCLAHVALGTRTLLRAASTAEARRRLDALRTWLNVTMGLGLADANQRQQLEHEPLQLAARHDDGAAAAAVVAQRSENGGANGSLVVGESAATALAADADEFRRLLLDAFKSALNFWQTGDIGKVPGMSMPQIMVGVVGTYISASDLSSMWTSSR